jgi:hypothetical protein
VFLRTTQVQICPALRPVTLPFMHKEKRDHAHLCHLPMARPLARRARPPRGCYQPPAPLLGRHRTSGKAQGAVAAVDYSSYAGLRSACDQRETMKSIRTPPPRSAASPALPALRLLLSPACLSTARFCPPSASGSLARCVLRTSAPPLLRTPRPAAHIRCARSPAPPRACTPRSLTARAAPTSGSATRRTAHHERTALRPDRRVRGPASAGRARLVASRCRTRGDCSARGLPRSPPPTLSVSPAPAVPVALGRHSRRPAGAWGERRRAALRRAR